MQDSIHHSSPALIPNVPCPFCSLLCDDLVISNENGQLRIKEHGCAKAVAGFERPLNLSSPRIHGKLAKLAEAISRVASLLRAAKQPLFSGLGTDIAGIRAVIGLADRTGGIVDHMHSEGAMRNVLVLQDRGWITTTLSEIKNRADLLVFAGTDVVRDSPRFFERVVWNEHSMFGLDTSARDIVYLGRGLDTRPGESPAGRKPLHIACNRNQLGEVAMVLRTLLAGATLQARNVAGVKITALQSLVERMKAARYGVLIWAPAQLDFPHAELAVQAFCELVKDLSQTTRFSGFSLGGNDGGISASSVCAWQSGYPLRTSFSQGYPDYDPWKYSTKDLLASGEVDVLIWISSFSEQPPPPVTDTPTVVIGLPDLKFKQEPEVFIPVATPGVDHTGQLLRCDSVVALPLRKLRESPLPTVANTLEAIQQAL